MLPDFLGQQIALQGVAKTAGLPASEENGDLHIGLTGWFDCALTYDLTGTVRQLQDDGGALLATPIIELEHPADRLCSGIATVGAAFEVGELLLETTGHQIGGQHTGVFDVQVVGGGGGCTLSSLVGEQEYAHFADVERILHMCRITLRVISL